ncbi:MAG: hypothetical protein M1834_005915 [Cirrosporium novae-zelandiae]|nr:MAG: hypothetical protein M1834_005915 [Cirrosporium novae-zelandiae]
MEIYKLLRLILKASRDQPWPTPAQSSSTAPSRHLTTTIPDNHCSSDQAYHVFDSNQPYTTSLNQLSAFQYPFYYEVEPSFFVPFTTLFDPSFPTTQTTNSIPNYVPSSLTTNSQPIEPNYAIDIPGDIPGDMPLTASGATPLAEDYIEKPTEQDYELLPTTVSYLLDDAISNNATNDNQHAPTYPSSLPLSTNNRPMTSSHASNVPSTEHPSELTTPTPCSITHSSPTRSHNNTSSLTSTSDPRIRKRQRNKIAAQKYRQKPLFRIAELESELETIKQERDKLKVQAARWEGEAKALRGLLEKGD